MNTGIDENLGVINSAISHNKQMCIVEGDGANPLCSTPLRNPNLIPVGNGFGFFYADLPT